MSLIKGEPIQKNLYSSIKLKSFLKKNNNKYSIVFFSTIRTCIYFNSFSNSKKVIDFIDSIGLNYLTAQKNTTSYFKKKFYNFFKLNCYVHKQILNYKEIISKSKKNFFSSG